MKKLQIDYKYLKIAIYVLGVIILAIVFEKTIGNIGSLYDNIRNFIKGIRVVLTPFIYGVFIAYILNSSLNFLEHKLFVKIGFLREKNKVRRILALAITYIALVGVLVWSISYLIPEIYKNLRMLIVNIQRIDFNSGFYVDNVITQFIDSINDTFGTEINFRDILNSFMEPITKSLTNIPSLVGMLLSGTASMASGLLKFFIGLIVSFYMLNDKESLGKAVNKFILTFFRKKDAEKVIAVFRSSNVVFQNFIIGKTLDSIIIGVIFFITCLFLKPPYALLLSVVVGVTNMIPYFGPFIGGIPVFLIVLLYNPMLSVWIGIDIFILQQFDGYILGPKILGESTGLKPLGVIFAITVGGAMFGVVGMFLGVPLFAVIKNMGNALINKLHDEKYKDKKDLKD